MITTGIVFLSSTLSSSDTRDYLSHKTGHLQCDIPDMLLRYESALTPLPLAGQLGSLQMAFSTKESTLLGKPTAVAKTQIRAVVTDVSSTFPLLEGENLIEQRFDFLEKDWSCYSAGTIVMVVRTDKSEIAFLFPNTRIINGELKEISFPERRMIRPGALMPVDTITFLGQPSVDWESIGWKITEGLASAIPGGECGVEILEMLVGKKEPSWDEMREQFLAGVKKELDQLVIDKANAAVAAVIQWLLHTYRNLDPSTPDLDAQLDLREQRIETCLQELGEQPRWLVAGMFDYVNAANTLLVVLQERYKIARKAKIKEGFKRAYADNARHCGEHIVYAIDTFHNQRYGNIHAVAPWSNTECADTTTGCVCHTYTGWNFNDDWTGHAEKFSDKQKCCKTISSKPRADKAYEKYMTVVNSEWESSYGPMKKAGETMETLAIKS